MNITCFFDPTLNCHFHNFCSIKKKLLLQIETFEVYITIGPLMISST